MPRFQGKALVQIDKTVYGSKEQVENLWRQWLLSGERLGITVLVQPEFEEIPE